MDPAEHVGVVLVHGIGDHGRFQHLDSQLRDLIYALQKMRRNGVIEDVTVDIRPAAAAAFKAQQDSWAAGPEPSVIVTVTYPPGSRRRETRLCVHEVWWADVNEPYSLSKQVHFWLWGLAIWAHPNRNLSLATSHLVRSPQVPGQKSIWKCIWARARLFLVGVFFVLLGGSVGAVVFVAGRLFNWQMPDVLKILTNYISGVKLYNQDCRFGPGLLRWKEDFLDTMGEPPRVSIRRRMIRTIADMALNDYSRWYVLAHSQGTVIAFNGLMETSYAWPGYLNKTRWTALRNNNLAGPDLTGGLLPTNRGQPAMPRRPAWAAPDEIAYRTKIFKSFRGFLTYGSPIEKFAAIWPRLVPIGLKPAFAKDVSWFNIFDPIDPVSGCLSAFRHEDPTCCPRPNDLGYAPSWWLLLAHIKYLRPRKVPCDLAMATARWILTDDASGFFQGNTGWMNGSWFLPWTPQHWLRIGLVWVSWIIAAILLAMLGGVLLPSFLQAAWSAISATGHAARQFLP